MSDKKFSEMTVHEANAAITQAYMGQSGLGVMSPAQLEVQRLLQAGYGNLIGQSAALGLGAQQMVQHISVSSLPRYVGADYETVTPSQALLDLLDEVADLARFDALAVEITGCRSTLLGGLDDGSAAHEPAAYTPNLDQAVSEVWRQRVRELSAENADQRRRLEAASSLPRYVGADYETVDDGSAAHEPDNAELRPPVEHEGKRWHWVQALPDAEIECWEWEAGQEADAYMPHGWYRSGCNSTILPTEVGAKWRYLGPAEWNPVAADVAKRLDAGAGAYHALSVASARIAELEAKVASLRDAVKQLASQLVASADAPATFPANALKHSV